jgi:hypothetical protein
MSTIIKTSAYSLIGLALSSHASITALASQSENTF